MAARTRLGVLGWPVAHSRSPQIQNAALEAAGLSGWRYQLLPVPPELFDETVRALPAAGFRGVNVTIPHKQAALALADEATDSRARDRRRQHAHVPRRRRDPRRQHRRPGADRCAAVRAGRQDGARARRRRQRPSRRVGAACEAGLRRFGSGTGIAERALGAGRRARWNGPRAGRERRICWSTARRSGWTGAVRSSSSSPSRPMTSRCTHAWLTSCTPTPTRRSSRRPSARGVPVVDGLDLLVGQGALSFERFTGRPAPVDAMRAAARSEDR